MICTSYRTISAVNVDWKLYFVDSFVQILLFFRGHLWTLYVYISHMFGKISQYYSLVFGHVESKKKTDQICFLSLLRNIFVLEQYFRFSSLSSCLWLLTVALCVEVNDLCVTWKRLYGCYMQNMLGDFKWITLSTSQDDFCPKNSISWMRILVMAVLFYFFVSLMGYAYT